MTTRRAGSPTSGTPSTGGQFEIVEDEVALGQVLAELLDRPGFAVVFRSADAMDYGHGQLPRAYDRELDSILPASSR
jgi:hypothetical protein